MWRRPPALATMFPQPHDGQCRHSVFSEQYDDNGHDRRPPKPVSRTVTQSGDISVSAPIGGTLMIAGHRVNVIAADESSITYTTN